MNPTFSLSSAPSTDNSSLLVLRDKGYALRVVCYADAGRDTSCVYIAEKEGRRYAANSGAELLGLVALWEHFGADWNRQEPDVIDEVMVPEADREEGAA